MRVAVLGLGAVGRGLLQMLAAKPELGFVLTAVADSSSARIDPDDNGSISPKRRAWPT